MGSSRSTEGCGGRLKQGKLERDNRRPEGGKGNKLAFYRLPGSCEVIPFPSQPLRGENLEAGQGENHAGDGLLGDDPVPGSRLTNTGEMETGSSEAQGTRSPLLKDPVPGFPAISSSETGTGSQEES